MPPLSAFASGYGATAPKRSEDGTGLFHSARVVLQICRAYGAGIQFGFWSVRPLRSGVSAQRRILLLHFIFQMAAFSRKPLRQKLVLTLALIPAFSPQEKESPSAAF